MLITDLDEYIKTNIAPFLMSPIPTHKMIRAEGGLKSKEEIHLLYLTRNLCAVCSYDKLAFVPLDSFCIIRASKKTKNNRGFSYEAEFLQYLKNAGVTPNGHAYAGSSPWSDFTIEANGIEYYGETKSSATRSDFGQLTVVFYRDRWVMPESGLKRRPGFARQIVKAGILEHMNKYHIPDKNVVLSHTGKPLQIKLPHNNLLPARSYLQDNGIDLLHVHGHGTYVVGDKLKFLGLSVISGKGQWIIREKTADKFRRTISFGIPTTSDLKHSEVDIENPFHMAVFKEKLRAVSKILDEPGDKNEIA